MLLCCLQSKQILFYFCFKTLFWAYNRKLIRVCVRVGVRACYFECFLRGCNMCAGNLFWVVVCCDVVSGPEQGHPAVCFGTNSYVTCCCSVLRLFFFGRLRWSRCCHPPTTSDTSNNSKNFNIQHMRARMLVNFTYCV